MRKAALKASARPARLVGHHRLLRPGSPRTGRLPFLPFFLSSRSIGAMGRRSSDRMPILGGTARRNRAARPQPGITAGVF